MKNYPYYPVKRYDTFDKMVAAMQEFGEKEAFAWYDRKENRSSITYTQLYSTVNNLKKRLAASGLGGKNCRLAVVSENSVEWIIAFLAAVSMGGVAVCVDIEQPDETIRELIRQADSTLVVASPTFLDICAPLLEKGDIKALYSTTERGRGQYTSIYTLAEQGESLSEPELQPIDRDDTAAIVFTSGTTSRSKPVMLTQNNILQNASSSMAMVEHGYNIFSSLPFFHSYGLSCAVINTMIKGATLTLNGDLRTMMRDLRLAAPESILAVPLVAEGVYTMLWAILEKVGQDEKVRKLLKLNRTFSKIGLPIGRSKLTEVKNKVLGPLRVLICGGAHLDPELIRNLQAFGITVVQGYGITECSPLISVNRNKANKVGTIGLPVPNCEVKLVEGEIWVKGENVMKGYYNDPEATAEAFEGEWFKTGDLGSIDSSGFISITGRIKNLIVLKNGKKISPEKLEELIGRIPLVKDVLVYGTSSGASTDDVKPAASIYPDPAKTQNMTSYEILEQLQNEVNKINATLPVYQQVQMINIREKEFDKTSSRKIKRYTN